MPTEYKINLYNLEGSAQKMWCFLSEPESNVSAEVYANSNSFLTVPTYSGSQQNSFTIPLQYSVQVGASNNAVGLDIQIRSSVTENTDLGVEWLANYTQESGEKIPPTLTQGGTAPSNELAITTNSYNKSEEPLNSWYGSMTYGVETAEGFIGLTWSPDPARTYEIKPKVTFYVAIGSFQSNTLADINAISSTSAEITENAFDGNNECTVTRNPDGTWSVAPGNVRPTNFTELLLLNSHLSLVAAHKELVDLIANK